jgi:hypothetical protein
MFELFLMLVLQIAFTFFRSLGTRNLVLLKVWKSVGLYNIIGGLYLVTTYLGMEGIRNALDTGDYWLLFMFFVGGSIGIYLNFKVKV